MGVLARVRGVTIGIDVGASEEVLDEADSTNIRRGGVRGRPVRRRRCGCGLGRSTPAPPPVGSTCGKPGENKVITTIHTCAKINSSCTGYDMMIIGRVDKWGHCVIPGMNGTTW